MAQDVMVEQGDQNVRPSSLIVHDEQVPIRIDKGGAVRIGPTRVTLETLIEYYKRGYRPERIQNSFPTLRLADIYSVIGYYLRHTEEVDEFLRQSELEAEAIRRKIEAYQHSDEFRARQQDHHAARQK
jgi:uncharacterized protein (DUF433 family)